MAIQKKVDKQEAKKVEEAAKPNITLAGLEEKLFQKVVDNDFIKAAVENKDDDPANWELGVNDIVDKTTTEVFVDNFHKYSAEGGIWNTFVTKETKDKIVRRVLDHFKNNEETTGKQEEETAKTRKNSNKLPNSDIIDTKETAKEEAPPKGGPSKEVDEDGVLQGRQKTYEGIVRRCIRN